MPKSNRNQVPARSSNRKTIQGDTPGAQQSVKKTSSLSTLSKDLKNKKAAGKPKAGKAKVAKRQKTLAQSWEPAVWKEDLVFKPVSKITQSGISSRAIKSDHGKKKCSWEVTGATLETFQLLYRCWDCFPLASLAPETEGTEELYAFVCYNCVANCHKGHLVQKVPFKSNVVAWCDCGSGFGKDPCQCVKQSTAKLTEAERAKYGMPALGSAKDMREAEKSRDAGAATSSSASTTTTVASASSSTTSASSRNASASSSSSRNASAASSSRNVSASASSRNASASASASLIGMLLLLLLLLLLVLLLLLFLKRFALPPLVLYLLLLVLPLLELLGLLLLLVHLAKTQTQMTK